jgi:hypothetical protein
MRYPDWVKTREAELLSQASQNEMYYITIPEIIPMADRLRYSNAIIAFTQKYAVTTSKTTRTQADVVAKNTAKKALIAIMREFYKRYIVGNTTITDEQRNQYNFPIYDKIPTPVPVPNTPPDFVIDFALSGLHCLHFGKFNTENKMTRGLPKGAHGVEIRRLVIRGESPLLDPEPEEMELVSLASKSPKDIRYNKNSKGSKVYYALRYFNDRGEYSLWSAVQMAIVN